MASNTTTQVKLQKVRDATATYLPATGALQLDGQSVKVSDVLSVLDAALQSMTATSTAAAALITAKATQKSKVASGLQEIAALKTALTVLWGASAPQLANFGFGKKPRTALTGEQLALRAAKAKLTREARGTKGSKAKLAITTSGQPGLVLVQPDGTQVQGVLTGPQPPASGAKAAVTTTPSAPPTSTK